MGKRSGFPHRDEELEKLSLDELNAELRRLQSAVTYTNQAKRIKELVKRSLWIEKTIAARD